MSSPEEQHATDSAQLETNHGAVIDPRGREIPITESMIQQACSELDKQWVKPGDENPS